MNTELITQIIILATALVGLYKAATFKAPKKDDSKDSSGNPVSTIFAAILSYLGIFIFMLAMPAFIWIFTWIVSNIGENDTNISVREYVIELDINEENLLSEYMFLAAFNIPYSEGKRDALIEVVDYSLINGDYKTAVIAAKSIPYSRAKEEKLNDIVQYIKRQDNSQELLIARPFY